MSAKRLISALIVASWLAPSVGALGVGLHLALDHRHHHVPGDGEHARELTDLLRTVAHGHHHDAEAIPDHAHEARLDGRAPAIRPAAASAAALVSPACAPAAPSPRTGLDAHPRRAPPPPLFTTHCALLL